jgi:hypothetical protein
MTYLARLLIVAFSLLAFGSVAQAAPSTSMQTTAESSAVATASYLEAAWSDRVCCKRGGHDWWTNRRECRRSGGYPVAGWQCRNDRAERVCCKKHGRDWWSSRRACYERGGHIVSRRECRWD